MRSKFLLAYSTRQLGYDPLPIQIKEALEANQVDIRICDVDLPNSKDFLQLQYDGVVVLEASSWYLENRLEFPKRSWTAICAFSVDNLRQFQKNGLNDNGINFLVSNCQSIVSQAANVIPATFMWKPAAPFVASDIKRGMIGCVIPNIADRDFSLIGIASSKLASSGDAGKVRIYLPVSEAGRLPMGLEQFVSRYEPGDQKSEMNAFASLSWYLPSPRITDYRGGVVPTDIIKALGYGVKPIIVKHQALAPIERFCTVCDSSESLRSAIMAAAKSVPDSVQFPVGMLPSPAEMASTLFSEFKRWESKNNAAARGA